MPPTESPDHVFCANCFHCKVVTSRNPKTEAIVYKVRCEAGMWKKRVGDDKLYRLDTVDQRRAESCPFYDQMGEPDEFLKDLRKLAARGPGLSESADPN